MIDILVFSKNRACQLDLMLRTLNFHFKLRHKITVLYLTTDNFFEAGYTILKQLYPHIDFKKQTDNFYIELKNILNNISNPYLLLLPDDAVFCGEVKEDDIQIQLFKSDSNIMNVNLRVGKYMKHNYFPDKHIIDAPVINEKGLYNWKTGNNIYWTHPLATCGHIMRSKEFKSILMKAVNVPNLNELEEIVIRNVPNKNLVVCYDYNRMIELCINLVNTTHTTNTHGTISVKGLNEKFIKYKRINMNFIAILPKEYIRFSDINLEFEEFLYDTSI